MKTLPRVRRSLGRSCRFHGIPVNIDDRQQSVGFQQSQKGSKSLHSTGRGGGGGNNGCRHDTVLPTANIIISPSRTGLRGVIGLQ